MTDREFEAMNDENTMRFTRRRPSKDLRCEVCDQPWADPLNDHRSCGYFENGRRYMARGVAPKRLPEEQ